MNRNLILFLIYLSFVPLKSEIKPNSGKNCNNLYFYFNPYIGRTYVNQNKPFGNGNIVNFGIAFSLQKWPHLFVFATESNREFKIGGEAKITTGYISELKQVKFLYNHLFHFPYTKKLFLGIGTGAAFLHVTQNGEYISDERSKKLGKTSLALPVGIRLGFLLPGNKINLLDLSYFRNYNSISNFWNWKLNLNIGFTIKSYDP